MAMKRKLRLFLANVAAVAALTSCATARFYSGFTPAAAGEMVLLGPVSTQFYIDANDKEFYSDSLSMASEELLSDVTVRLGMPVKEIFPLDSLQMEETVGFMRYLDAASEQKVGEAPIPSALDELLEAEGYRYGLLMYAEGMTRDRSRYVKDAVGSTLLSVFIAVATLGLIVPYAIPVAHTSAIYAAVLDSETNRVVFFNWSGPREVSPLEEKHVRSQLADIFRDFIYRR